MKMIRSNKRSRILGLQKQRLVNLVENFYIRTTGRNFKVNGIAIDQAIWEAFARELNSLGPPKSANEWRVSFNTMKSRVRKTMLIILECGGIGEDNLSDIDLRIYKMFPHESNKTEECSNENMHQSQTKFQELDFTAILEAHEDVEKDVIHNVDTQFEELDLPITSFIDEEENWIDSENEAEFPVFDKPLISDEHEQNDLEYEVTLEDSSLNEVLISEMNARPQCSVNQAEAATFDKTTGRKLRPHSRDWFEKTPGRREIVFDEQAKISVQYERLMELLQKIFLLTAAGKRTANGIEYEDIPWQVFANELNLIGPSKTASEWEKFLDTMKAKVRNKVLMVLECDGNPKDNLSEVDQKVYELFLRDIYEIYRDDECDEFCTDSQEHEEYMDASRSTHPKDLSRRIENSELNARMICHARGRSTTSTRAPHLSHPRATGILPSKNTRGRSIGLIRGQGRGSRQQNLIKPPAIRHNDLRKEFMRISDIQKERLIQLIHNNLLETFGRYSGANGVEIKRKLWVEFATELNTLGPAKSIKQWKNCLDYIKGTAKMKLAINRSNDNEFGRGRKLISRLEEKIIAVYGLDNLDGQQGLGEGGFEYEKTVGSGVQISNISTYHDLNRRQGAKISSSTVTSGGHTTDLTKNLRKPLVPQSSQESSAKTKSSQPVSTITSGEYDAIVANEEVHSRNVGSDFPNESTSSIDVSTYHGLNPRQGAKIPRSTATSGGHTTDLTRNLHAPLVPQSSQESSAKTKSSQPVSTITSGEYDAIVVNEEVHSRNEGSSFPNESTSSIDRGVSHCEVETPEYFRRVMDTMNKNMFSSKDLQQRHKIFGRKSVAGLPVSNSANNSLQNYPLITTGRVRERSFDRDRERSVDEDRERSVDRDREGSVDRDRGRNFGGNRGRNVGRDRRGNFGGYRYRERNVDGDRERSVDGDLERSVDRDRERSVDRDRGRNFGGNRGRNVGRDLRRNIGCYRDRNVGADRERNRFTSYAMVERSIIAQEQFIEQSDRNHSEMIFLFAATLDKLANPLNKFANTLGEYLNKK